MLLQTKNKEKNCENKYRNVKLLFKKLLENGVFVWLPNALEKEGEAQMRGGTGHCWRLKTGAPYEAKKV